MELNSIKHFVAVADFGGVAKAAQILHCVPSNVSARIKALEEELGGDLFYRKSKGMPLTPFGKKLRPIADQMIQLEGDALQLNKETLNLNLGSMETFAAIQLPLILGELYNK